MRGLEYGLTSCGVCLETVCFTGIKSESVPICPRCGEEVYPRKPNSIQKTWALIFASIIFYIPANLLPMMHIDTFAGTQSDTIISGVIYFIETGSYMVGTVIFIASILVPIAKVLILIYLLISVQRNKSQSRLERLRMYALTELVGKWSMVDIYVVSIMVAIVHFGGLTNIHAGAAANYFLLVVIMTMLAATSFDSRLIWDNHTTKEKNAGNH